MDDASDALREAHARRVRRVLESLEDASCRKRREADELEKSRRLRSGEERAIAEVKE